MRHGEIASVPVVHRIVPAQGGSAATTELSIDIESAPIPTRRYTASVTAGRLESETVKLYFAQRKIVGDGLRSLVSVAVSFEATKWFRRSYGNLLPSLRHFVNEKSIHRPDSLAFGNEEPAQTVELTANIIAVAFVGSEACIDIYSASPFAFRAIRDGGNQLPIEPLLRVDLTSGALLTMLEDIEGFAGKIAADTDKAQTEVR
jgi:hypothetical protein